MFWEVYYFCLISILGLLIGSFLNVCIYRVPLKESIAKGSSHCTSCQQKIKRYDLIPVFSYLFLRGKCRNCKSKISPRYPIIELVNCLMYILIYITFGISVMTLILCALVSVLIVVTMIDIDTGEIPNGLIIFILCLSPLVLFLDDMPIWERLIGFVAASLILLIFALVADAFGGGDIKLMAACGLLLGYKNILLALFIGIILGGILGGILLITRKKKGKKATMAFGPALAAGVMFSSLYGTQILDWYISKI